MLMACGGVAAVECRRSPVGRFWRGPVPPVVDDARDRLSFVADTLTLPSSHCTFPPCHRFVKQQTYTLSQSAIVDTIIRVVRTRTDGTIVLRERCAESFRSRIQLRPGHWEGRPRKAESRARHEEKNVRTEKKSQIFPNKSNFNGFSGRWKQLKTMRSRLLHLLSGRYMIQM